MDNGTPEHEPNDQDVADEAAPPVEQAADEATPVADADASVEEVGTEEVAAEAAGDEPADDSQADDGQATEDVQVEAPAPTAAAPKESHRANRIGPGASTSRHSTRIRSRAASHLLSAASK